MFSTHLPQVAAYLRCYPFDQWQMNAHRRAIEEHATRLGLPWPRFFLDNGVSSRRVQPQLRLLLARAVTGHIDIVLVPGGWVFSLDAGRSSAVTAYLRGAGVEIIELPQHREKPQHPLLMAQSGVTPPRPRGAVRP